MDCCTGISEVARELTSRKEADDLRPPPSVTRPGATLAIESGIRASAGLNGTRQPPEIPTTIEAAITIGVADRDGGRCAFATKFGLWFFMAQPLARNYEHLLSRCISATDKSIRYLTHPIATFSLQSYKNSEKSGLMKEAPISSIAG
jgi:hypothetical protein